MCSLRWYERNAAIRQRKSVYVVFGKVCWMKGCSLCRFLFLSTMKTGTRHVAALRPRASTQSGLDSTSALHFKWVEFIFGSRLAPSVFSGFFGFPPSSKTNITKLQFDQDRGPTWKLALADAASSLNIFIYSFKFIRAVHPKVIITFHLGIRLVLLTGFLTWWTRQPVTTCTT